MKLLNMKNTLVASAVSLLMLIGGVGMANAQNTTEEYREWQRAQRQAQEEYQDYLRTRSPRDYRDWQQAQRMAQQEYLEYQRASRMGTSSPYYNAGYNMDRGRNYRIYRNGRTHRVDYRGAEALRQAVNRGYQRGYQQGQLDRRYGRRMNYYDDNDYRRATFGYVSYVDRNLYQHYFQQGFQRGYEDGYYSRTRYGYRTNTGLNVLGGVLNTILNLAQDDDN